MDLPVTIRAKEVALGGLGTESVDISSINTSIKAETFELGVSVVKVVYVGVEYTATSSAPPTGLADKNKLMKRSTALLRDGTDESINKFRGVDSLRGGSFIIQDINVFRSSFFRWRPTRRAGH